MAAAKRRLLLVNDSQVAAFDSKIVRCTLCGVNVVLEGDGDFNLTKWNGHKSTCIKCVLSANPLSSFLRHSVRAIPVSQNDATNSISFPKNLPPHPPLSSASTEDTLVFDAGLSDARQGLKRPRDESESSPGLDMPKAVRPRTESYLPATMEPPNSILGWVMLPFHSFVRGFKESLSDRS